MEFDVSRIDEVIHGKVRLGVIAYLATVDAAEFNELKALLDATAGNLSVHLRKLEEAGYIKVSKAFISRKSLTKARITPRGRAAFVEYLAEVRRLVDSHGMRSLSEPSESPPAASGKARRHA